MKGTTNEFMFSRLAALLTLLTATTIPTQATDLDTMIGQMLMAGFRGYEVTADSSIMRDIRERHLGGVILFDYDVALGRPERNIKSPEQVKKLTNTLAEAADIPLFIGVDQEGGKVQRLKSKYGFPETPSAQELGASSNNAVYEAGYKVGKTLRKAGFNLDFAPVATSTSTRTARPSARSVAASPLIQGAWPSAINCPARSRTPRRHRQSEALPVTAAQERTVT